MALSKFKLEDFDFNDPQTLVDTLNAIDEEIEKIQERAAFCKEHGFFREAEYLKIKASCKTSVIVSVCNSLGRYF